MFKLKISTKGACKIMTFPEFFCITCYLKGACLLHNYKKVFDSLLDSSFEIRPVIFISHTNETSKSNNTQVVPSIILVKVTRDKHFYPVVYTKLERQIMVSHLTRHVWHWIQNAVVAKVTKPYLPPKPDRRKGTIKDDGFIWSRQLSSNVSTHSKAAFLSSRPSSTTCLKGPRSTVLTNSCCKDGTSLLSRWMRYRLTSWSGMHIMNLWCNFLC